MTRRPKQSREEAAAARRELAEQLHTTITDKMAALTQTEEWTAFLTYATKFHAYSLNNLLLILAQHPEASQVAGYNQWLSLGRHVRAGEKAIRIRGFSTRKITEVDTDTGEETDRKVPRFPILSVFDISQTDPNTEVTDWMRKKNPDARLWVDVEQPVQKLTGEDPADIYTRTRELMGSHGWTVAREPIPGDTNGYTTTDGTRRIIIDEHLHPAQAAKTMIHEAAHALMHETLEPGEYIAHRGRFEVEAESVAYVVAGMLGLDTSSYSIGYIASWSAADPALIAATATRVLETSRRLAAEIDPDTENEDSDTAA